MGHLRNYNNASKMVAYIKGFSTGVYKDNRIQGTVIFKRDK